MNPESAEKMSLAPEIHIKASWKREDWNHIDSNKMGRHWHKRKAKEEENIFTERLSLLRLPKVGIVDSAT